MAIRQHIIRFPLIPACLVLLCALAPMLPAQPHVMADEEMDQVCAKGSTGVDVDPVVLNQMVFEFSRQTSLGLVSASGAISVEMIPNSSGKSPIFQGTPITVASGTPTTPGSTPITISPTDLQVANGTVRVTGDLNINMQTLPSVLRALQQNRLVLPPGFSPWAGIQGMGAIR